MTQILKLFYRLTEVFSAAIIFVVIVDETLPAAEKEWRQEVQYFIDAELDPVKNILSGAEKIVYVNHSPDTLDALYFNLYINAFRRNSNMRYYQDLRYKAFGGSWLGLLPDYTLGEVEILSVNEKNGGAAIYESDDTILKILLPRPLAPGQTCTLFIEFSVRIPVHIRRMGRHNREGVDYTMAQWYPKVCVYDRKGWHLDYYLGREFFGEFGTYDVSITLPEDYVVAASGKLMNAPDHGLMMNIPSDSTTRFRLRDSVIFRQAAAVSLDSAGISDEWLDSVLSKLTVMGETAKTENRLRTWRFRLDHAHDFAWSADPDYIYTDTLYGQTRVHILHLPDVEQRWQPMKSWITAILKYMEDNVGPYPYPDLTVAQAGDGGMEYPALSFITGRRGSYSLASVTAHEVIHNWFYGALANDEVHEAWLDEGMTSYYTTRVMESMFGRYAIKERRTAWPFSYEYTDDARIRTFSDYEWWAKQGYEEPVLKHSDRFLTDESYGYSVYTKGHIVMNALEYYFGKERFDSLMKKYYSRYAFGHVSTCQFKRFLEKESGARMEGFFSQWLSETAQCDYGIGRVDGHWEKEQDQRYYASRIQIIRKGTVVMPVDVFVLLDNGEWSGYRIPSSETDPDLPELERRPVWSPFKDEFTLILETDEKIKRVVIDTSMLMPDIQRQDNASGILPRIDWSFQRPWNRPPMLGIYRIEHRPSFWFNHPDGLRTGYQIKGQWAVDQHRLKAGFYYGIRSRQPDYQFEYSTPFYSACRQVELAVKSYRLEGRLEQDVSVKKKWFGAGYDYPPYHTMTAGFRYARLYNDDYLPSSIRWDRGHQTSFYINYQFRPGYRIENRLDAATEFSYLYSKQRYARMDLTYRYTIQWIPKFVDIRSRSFFGYATGQVPAQSLFYLAGASPRDMFHQPLYRSAGTMPRQVWVSGENRRWYLDGDGSISGYYNADISTKKILTQSFEFTVPNIFYLMMSRDLLILNRSEPFIFFEGGIFWKKNRSLFRHFRDAAVVDAGAGFIYRLSFIPSWMGRYQFRFECPIWVSKPSLNSTNEKHFKKRWVVGLTKEISE